MNKIIDRLPRASYGRGMPELLREREKSIAELELARLAIQLAESRIDLIDNIISKRRTNEAN